MKIFNNNGNSSGSGSNTDSNLGVGDLIFSKKFKDDDNLFQLNYEPFYALRTDYPDFTPYLSNLQSPVLSAVPITQLDSIDNFYNQKVIEDENYFIVYGYNIFHSEEYNLIFLLIDKNTKELIKRVNLDLGMATSENINLIICYDYNYNFYIAHAPYNNISTIDFTTEIFKFNILTEVFETLSIEGDGKRFAKFYYDKTISKFISFEVNCENNSNLDIEKVGIALLDNLTDEVEDFDYVLGDKFNLNSEQINGSLRKLRNQFILTRDEDVIFVNENKQLSTFNNTILTDIIGFYEDKDLTSDYILLEMYNNYFVSFQEYNGVTQRSSFLQYDKQYNNVKFAFPDDLYVNNNFLIFNICLTFDFSVETAPFGNCLIYTNAAGIRKSINFTASTDFIRIVDNVTYTEYYNYLNYSVTNMMYSEILDNFSTNLTQRKSYLIFDNFGFVIAGGSQQIARLKYNNYGIDDILVESYILDENINTYLIIK